MTEENCDCGWRSIPQGASFCPGCGKPLTAQALEIERQANAFQRPRAEEEESGPAERVTFGTPGALRSCYWSAAFAAIVMSLPYGLLFFFVVFPGAGFYAVHSFRKQTHRKVTVRSGAKLGFLTGVITFALLLILMTIATSIPGAPGLDAQFDEVEAVYRQQGKADVAASLQQLRQDRGALALAALMVLSLGFCVTAGFAAAGGAIGAKVLEDG